MEHGAEIAETVGIADGLAARVLFAVCRRAWNAGPEHLKPKAAQARARSPDHMPARSHGSAALCDYDDANVPHSTIAPSPSALSARGCGGGPGPPYGQSWWNEVTLVVMATHMATVDLLHTHADEDLLQSSYQSAPPLLFIGARASAQ